MTPMPQYAYIWLRFGMNPGLAYVVPGFRLEQARATLRILAARYGYAWHEFENLERALGAVSYAVRTGGGRWAGPCGLLFCATDSHGPCLQASVDAAEWLWDPFAAERRASAQA